MSGLSFRTSEESLRNAFQSFGQLIEVNLVMDKIANRPRGFAFLRYATKEESEKAIEGMHGKVSFYFLPFVLEPRVSLEAASLSLGIEARSVFIPPSPDPISSLLFVGFTGYGCCCYPLTCLTLVPITNITLDVAVKLM
ncbi:putative RNA recognition motif domain, nucleotide-binding alpha-beta plait domain superfamily [Helianthus debilis subsp. tardiflorus]